MGRCRGRRLGRRRLDGEETLRCCCTSLGGSKAQIDLEKIVGFLGRGGPRGRVVHDTSEVFGRGTSRESNVDDGSVGSDRLTIEEARMSDGAQTDALSGARSGWIWVDPDGWEKEFKMSVTRRRRNKQPLTRCNKCDCLQRGFNSSSKSGSKSRWSYLKYVLCMYMPKENKALADRRGNHPCRRWPISDKACKRQGQGAARGPCRGSPSQGPRRP